LQRNRSIRSKKSTKFFLDFLLELYIFYAHECIADQLLWQVNVKLLPHMKYIMSILTNFEEDIDRYSMRDYFNVAWRYLRYHDSDVAPLTVWDEFLRDFIYPGVQSEIPTIHDIPDNIEGDLSQESDVVDELTSTGLGFTKAFDNENSSNTMTRHLKLPNDRESQFILGINYENGWGGERNMNKALECYRSAAANGSSRAQTYLGILYKNGWHDKPADCETAFELLSKAYLENHEAQLHLGIMNENGWGIGKDVEVALECFQMAEKNGNLVAKHKINELLQNVECSLE